MNWLAIISNGTYPAPVPTLRQRAAYGVSYGLLGVVSGSITSRGASLLMMLIDE